jgi:hypothetical protein
MLANFSIRAKIAAVVAFLLVAMTGMGLLAVRNMRAIDASTVDITTNWLPSDRVLGDLRAGVITYRKEQGAATQEISRNVQQAAHGTQQVSSNITDVQRGASETGSASSQVLSAAQSLSGDSNRLKLEVGKFLNSVRAA